MIDKIEVTLDDCGMFVVNVGDILITTIEKPGEVGGIVAEYSKKLACFPQSIHSGQANPITFAEFMALKKAKKTPL